MYFGAGFRGQKGQNVMSAKSVVSAKSMEQWVEPVAQKPGEYSRGRLVVVVGFDGSAAASRALDAARQLISGRPGSMVVVYVAHLPAGAELSPEAQVESFKGFDALQQQYTEAIRSRLDGVEQRWSLQRRDGAVAHELLAAADQVGRDHGDDAAVVIVVGRAMHATITSSDRYRWRSSVTPSTRSSSSRNGRPACRRRRARTPAPISSSSAIRQELASPRRLGRPPARIPPPPPRVVIVT
jgi:nucleotide-binding universal stress UspA family protein